LLTSFFVPVLALPPPTRDPSFKQILERLNAVPAEERSIKFLLSDEFLHQYGLLHPSRFTQPHEAPTEVPDSPTKTLDASVSTKDRVQGETSTGTPLVKCSTPRDDTGPSEKSALPPITEEEEEQPSQTMKNADKGTDGGNQARHDDDDVFGDLSDLFISSQELSKDDPARGKVIPPTIEVTSALQLTPTFLFQELPPIAKPITSPQLRSGSLAQCE
jgi:hypothetical protein